MRFPICVDALFHVGTDAFFHVCFDAFFNFCVDAVFHVCADAFSMFASMHVCSSRPCGSKTSSWPMSRSSSSLSAFSTAAALFHGNWSGCTVQQFAAAWAFLLQCLHCKPLPFPLGLAPLPLPLLLFSPLPLPLVVRRGTLCCTMSHPPHLALDRSTVLADRPLPPRLRPPRADR